MVLYVKRLLELYKVKLFTPSKLFFFIITKFKLALLDSNSIWLELYWIWVEFKDKIINVTTSELDSTYSVYNPTCKIRCYCWKAIQPYKWHAKTMFAKIAHFPIVERRKIGIYFTKLKEKMMMLINSLVVVMS